MPYAPKTAIRLKELPPELCTRKEAAAILGLTGPRCVDASPRCSNLRYAEVILNNRRTFVYNRAEVEALKYPDPPANYITTLHAAEILGIKKHTPILTVQAARRLLRKHNIPCKIARCHHSYQVWHTPSILALKKKLKHQTSNIKHST